MDFREQLQSALAPAYILERELGGGGMSHVFVAEERALGRKVVVKVLPPETAAGVSIERFKREIGVAARLQHPHIVPVLSAGEAGALPYYTMPLAEGESLRARLAEAGPLPLGEAIGILRDVAKALAYAHARGVVHRDIKPDNVLLSGGAAVVTDFGIAKALSASRTEAGGPSLTGIGVSIGTPSYMAPEQVAADPSADHRADLYAFGAMAYELLTGRPPFVASTTHRVLAAQISERPAPVDAHRPGLPPALVALVMRCLEKGPDDRPQSAEEVLKLLDAAGSGEAAAAPVVRAAAGRTLRRALALWALAFVGVALVAWAAVITIGLPDWVFPGVLALMTLGLPAILLTALVHRQAHLAHTVPTHTPGGSATQASTVTRLAVKARPWVTWRRTAQGGMAAVGAFALLVVVYMVLRALGIGPAGSLMAAGRIGAHERIVVADFGSPAGDSALGAVVSDAFRADLAQSANLQPLQSTAVRDVLRRMQRPADLRVDLTLAREIAAREGVRAVVDGDVLAIGGSYVVSATLVAAQSGEELASVRATADDGKHLIGAIDELARKLRARIGESLKAVRETPPLEQVTTSSLAALRKYAEGARAIDEGNESKGVALLEEAIALDTGFAMAYRRLAAHLGNRGGQEARVIQLLQKAYDHRDRLSDVERYHAMGAYWWNGPHPDPTKAIAAFEALLDIRPNDARALNNVSLLYSDARDYGKSVGYLERAIVADPKLTSPYTNLIDNQVALGRQADAERTAALFLKNLPQSWLPVRYRADLAYVSGRIDSAEAITDSLRRARPADPDVQANAGFALGDYTAVQGRIAEARRWWRGAHEASRLAGLPREPLAGAVQDAFTVAWYLDEKEHAVRMLDSALARQPLDSIPAADRPLVNLAITYAAAGRPDRARAMLVEFDRSRASLARRYDALGRHAVLGFIALAERRYGDGVREFRDADAGGCVICALPDLARAYDLGGQADSAIAVYERYIRTPGTEHPEWDATYLAGAHKRLGELYEAKGDRADASRHYAAFVALWKDADPALQPRVVEVRARLAQLGAAEPR